MTWSRRTFIGAAASSAISFAAERIFAQVDQNNTMGWAGADVGAWIQAAYNSLPVTGGTIYVAPKADGSAYAWTSAIDFGTNNKIVTIEGAGAATCLRWTPTTGTAITCNWGDQHIPASLLKNLQLTGPGAATATTAVLIGSSRLTDQASIEGVFITGFGVGINTGLGDGVVGYDLTFSHMGIYTNGVGVLIPANSIPVRIIQCEISQNTIAGISVTGSAAEVTLIGCDIEPQVSGAVGIAVSGNSYIHGFGNHFEESAAGSWQFILGTATDARLTLYGGEMWDDLTSGTQAAFVTWAGDALVLDGITVWCGIGRTVTEVVHSTSTFCSVFLRLINVANGTIAATLGGSTPDNVQDFSQTLTGQWSNVVRISSGAAIGGGLEVGAPAGGNKGAGTINVAAGIYLNGAAFRNPDYVFEKWATGKIEIAKANSGASDYELWSLGDTEAYARQHHRLPRVGERLELFSRADILLEKIEELYVHIFELNKRIATLEGA